jgi:hypothetical protein
VEEGSGSLKPKSEAKVRRKIKSDKRCRYGKDKGSLSGKRKSEGDLKRWKYISVK